MDASNQPTKGPKDAAIQKKGLVDGAPVADGTAQKGLAPAQHSPAMAGNKPPHRAAFAAPRFVNL